MEETGRTLCLHANTGLVEKLQVGLDGFVKLIGTRSNFGRPQLPCQPSSLVEAGNQCIATLEGCPASNSVSFPLNGRAQRKAIKADKK